MATEKRSPEPGPQLVAVPGDLIVEIHDWRAAEDVTADAMRAWLRARGWHRATGDVAAELWEWPEGAAPGSHGFPPSMLVPLATDYVDYGRKVLDFVRRAAAFEGVSQLAVWVELRAASQEGDGK